MRFLQSVFKAPGPDEYARVRSENDWVSMQVGRYPQRLIGICSVNPLREYAPEEFHRIESNTAPYLNRVR